MTTKEERFNKLKEIYNANNKWFPWESFDDINEDDYEFLDIIAKSFYELGKNE